VSIWLPKLVEVRDRDLKIPVNLRIARWRGCFSASGENCTPQY
jgi:hypothetical protein